LVSRPREVSYRPQLREGTYNLDGKAGMMRCEKSDGFMVAIMPVPVNGW